MPNPQNSSFLYLPNLKETPYKDWLEYVENDKQFNMLIQVFRETPKLWVQWVEEQTQANQKNGSKISDHLGYRLSVLLNGIIYLQESKFICDMLENTFRQNLMSYSLMKDVPLSELRRLIPKWDALQKNYEKGSGRQIDLGMAISSNLLAYFEFYQLTETIARHWDHIGTKDLGFREIFWTSKKCRDVNLFQRDMGSIRNYRNRIAHSKGLFTPRETQFIYLVSTKWLNPLGVRIEEKVAGYRVKRPRFLEDLALP